MGRRLLIALAAVAALCLAPPVSAQTTGRIVGTAVDQQSAAVPGVTVSVTSPQLQGARETVTDSVGEFRFLSLPPGTYMIKATLAGFKTVERPNVIVGLEQTVTLPLTMSVASVAETVNVTAASPVVDTTSTAGGIVANADQFNRLPMRRDFYGITKIAPGATEDAVGPSMYGATGAENQYIIEGLNSTGVEHGAKMKTLNFDFVDSVEVKTTGLNAEYGRMTGGLINVITKSGGNAFHGDVFGFGEGGKLQSDESTASKRPETTTTVANIGHRADYGADLGGFIVKDKLWFFGSFDRVDQRDETQIIRLLTAPGSPAIGSSVPADIKTNLFATKLTYRLSNNHTLVGSVNGDPSTRDGNVFVIAGPPSTWQGIRKTGNPDVVARYDGVLGSTGLIRAMFGQHKEKTELTGAGASTPQLTDRTVSPTVNTGGFGGYQNSDFTRRVYKADLTKIFSNHEIKAGADYEDTLSRVDRFSGGAGQLIYKLIVPTTGVIYYRHRYFIDDLAPGFSRTDSSTWKIAVPLTASPKTKNASVYAQDSFKALSNLTLNFGVRWERQNMLDRNDAIALKLDKNWAPRIGFVWDPTNKGKAKVYASYGRFFESIPMDINIRSFGGEQACFCYNFDPSPSAILGNPAAPSRTTLFGSPITPVDPNLKGQYSDEVLGGFEYEVAPNIVAGAKITRRNLGRVIEDFLVPAEGSYFIANPGQGTLGKSLGMYEGDTAPAPATVRKNTSVELILRKRYADNWQLLASYVFSKLEGNYDGTFQNSTGQLDPNINSAFDYGDFLVNANGALTNEHRHQLKLDGSYTFTGAAEGLNLGASLHWFSGLPLTAYGYSFAYQNWEYYLTPRGSLGRGPSDYEMDLSLGYPIKLGSNVKANLLVDVFNLFDRQAITVLDQRYNLTKDGHCGGIPNAICNGDGGLGHKPNTTDPIGVLSNPRSTATNVDFLKAGTGFTLPRSIRLGVRLTF